MAPALLAAGSEGAGALLNEFCWVRFTELLWCKHDFMCLGNA